MTSPRIWAARTGVAGGLAVLLAGGWQLWGTNAVADHATGQVTTALERDFSAHSGHARAQKRPPANGVGFALLSVPRFGADWVRPVVAGTDTDDLRKGVGHYDGTAMPGQVGNFAIAGHRTTWGQPFHNIDRLKKGDLILVRTATARYTYAVRSHEIVTPTDVDVIGPNREGAWLTMTACHPKYSAAKRYVVHAQLVSTDG
jgi:sortase A